MDFSFSHASRYHLVYNAFGVSVVCRSYFPPDLGDCITFCSTHFSLDTVINGIKGKDATTALSYNGNDPCLPMITSLVYAAKRKE